MSMQINNSFSNINQAAAGAAGHAYIPLSISIELCETAACPILPPAPKAGDHPFNIHLAMSEEGPSLNNRTVNVLPTNNIFTR